MCCTGRGLIHPIVPPQLLPALQHWEGNTALAEGEAPSPTAAVPRLDLQVFTHSPQPPLLSLLCFNVESSNPLAQQAHCYQIAPEEFWARSFTEQTGLLPL